MTSRSHGRTAVLLVVGWVVLCGLVVAWGWVLTHPLASGVDPWENGLARRIADARTPALDAVADVGTFVGDTIVGGVVLALTGVGFSLARRTWRPLVHVVVTYGGLGVLYVVATHVDPRQRPPVRILDPGLIPDHSFPSGHTATSTAVVGCLLALTATYAPRALRWTWPLLLLPPLTMAARLYQGAHHLTDVLTGLCYATVWVVLTWRLLLHDRAPVARRGPASPARPAARQGRGPASG